MTIKRAPDTANNETVANAGMIGLPVVTRNMDLLRDLLLQTEANPEMDGTAEFTFTAEPGHSLEEITYHVQLLLEAGYLKGNRSMATVSRLTWDGHEFLDNIKDAGIWNKTKKQMEGLPAVSLSVAAQIATALVKKHLGLT